MQENLNLFCNEPAVITKDLWYSDWHLSQIITNHWHDSIKWLKVHLSCIVYYFTDVQTACGSEVGHIKMAETVADFNSKIWRYLDSLFLGTLSAEALCQHKGIILLFWDIMLLGDRDSVELLSVISIRTTVRIKTLWSLYHHAKLFTMWLLKTLLFCEICQVFS